MRHDGLDASLIHASPKAPHLRRIERRALPAIRVLRENLKRLAAVTLSAVDGVRHAARDRHVGTDAHQRN